MHNTTPSPTRTAISTILALGMSAMLVFAAVMKLRFPSADPDHLWHLPGFEEAMSKDIPISVAELIIALLVLAFHRWKVTWACSALMFAGFTGYQIVYVVNDLPCGCFGPLTPPAWLTLNLDIFFAIGSLSMAAAWGLRKKGLIALPIAMAFMLGIGYAYASSTTETEVPPVVDEDGNVTEQLPPAERLLQTDLLADIATAEDFTVYYLFIYDPSCHSCEHLKNTCVDFDEQHLATTGDPFLQVRQYNKYDLREQYGIEDYAWPGSPTLVLVLNGEVLNVLSGEAVPCPGTLEALDNGYEGDDGVYSVIANQGIEALRPPAPPVEAERATP